MQELKASEIINQFTEAGIDEAFQVARKKQLPVLIDFWAYRFKTKVQLLKR